MTKELGEKAAKAAAMVLAAAVVGLIFAGPAGAVAAAKATAAGWGCN